MLSKNNTLYTKKSVSSDQRSERGFTLFYALVVVGVVALMAFGVSRTALNEVVFSSLGNKSQQAFFAANSGLECALYWDLRHAQFLPDSVAVIDEQDLYCAGKNVRTHADGDFERTTAGSTFTTKFTVTDLNDSGSCANVEVIKTEDSSGVLQTRIESDGQNACDSSARDVQRSIRVEY